MKPDILAVEYWPGLGYVVMAAGQVVACPTDYADACACVRILSKGVQS